MDSIILAGGNGIRLGSKTPKPLQIIRGKPVIEHILSKIESVDNIDNVFVSTAEKLESYFKEWKSSYNSRKNLELVIEPTLEDGSKLGAIGGLSYAVDKCMINEDTLVIGGDNVLEFSLKEFIDYAELRKKSTVAVHELEDKEKIKGKYGVCKLDKDNKIIYFEEKPEEPKSNLVSTACYLFSKEDLGLVKQYLKTKENRDSIGYFIEYLQKNSEVYGFVFEEPWFDIGDPDSLADADLFLRQGNQYAYPDKRVLIVEDKPWSMSQAICGCSYIAYAVDGLVPPDHITLTRAIYIDRLKDEEPYDLIISSSDYNIPRDTIIQLRRLFPSTKIVRQIAEPKDNASEEFKQLPYIDNPAKTFEELFGPPKEVCCK